MPAKQLLIVRLPNWLGDTLMSLPALDALQKSGFDLTLLGKPWAKDLFSAMPYRIADKPLAQLEGERILLFTNSFSSAWQSFRANKRAIGYRGDWRRLFLEYAIQKPKHKYHHESKKLHDLAAFAAKKLEAPFKASRNHELILPPAPAADIINDYIVICPFATGKSKNHQSKQWPHWPKFIEHLGARHVNMVCCPGPGEHLTLDQIPRSLRIIDNISLLEYARIMQRARLVISNDSGPMHLAAAIKAPLLGLFGVTDPNRTHPLSGHYLGSTHRWPDMVEILSFVEKYL